MADTQQSPATERNYLDHFGLTRPPFAALPDPGEIFEAEQYALLGEHLAAAAEDTDHLVVVRGADGSGKTTLLNRHVDSLSEDSYFATVDQSCESETDFYCTFLQQLGFDGITGKLGELRTIANEFLVHRARAGDTVLLIIDNIHHVRPTVLEQLRRIATTTIDGRRVISTVISGNSHIRRIMDSPAMQDLRFHDYVDFHIRAYTEQETAGYTRHRFRLAGAAADAIFTADGYAMIHRYSGGIPGQINRLGDALLADAMHRKVRTIHGECVRSVADTLQLPPHVIPLQGKGRRKSDGETERTTDPGYGTVSIAARRAAPAAPGAAASQPFKPEGPRIDSNALLARLASLSEQIERLKLERHRTSQDISERDRTIAQLTEALDRQTGEVRTLAGTVHDNAGELDRLRSTLAETGLELEENSALVRKLTSDLKSESRSARAAQKKLERAEARIDRFEALRSEWLATVAELRSELDVANEKASHVVVLQRELAIASEKLTRIEALRSELEAAREECARLQSEAVAKVELEASLVEKDSEIGKLRAQIAAMNLDSTATLKMRNEQPKTAAQPAAAAATGSPSDNAIARFEIFKGGKLLHTIQSEDISARCMIGRGEDCELRLESKFVSQHHALLFCTGTSAALQDLNSSNGTLVNSERITRRELQPDDVINIGDFQIRPRRS